MRRVPTSALGGLLSDADRWAKFESRWQEILHERDLPYSHMREFAHSTGPFTKSKSNDKRFERERREFLGKLCDATIEFSEYSFGFVMTKAHYEVYVPNPMKSEMGAPCPFLARWCLVRIGVWASNRSHDEPIDVVFERRQPEHTIIRLQHNIIAAREKARREFRIGGLSFSDKYDKENPNQSVTQLQGADLVAYEIVKNGKDLSSNPSAKMRHPMRRLMQIPPYLEHIDPCGYRSGGRGLEEDTRLRRGTRRISETLVFASMFFLGLLALVTAFMQFGDLRRHRASGCR
jgi:hypothetical protein